MINNGYNNPTNANNRFSHSITKLYYLCLIYLGEFDKIIESTNNWKNAEHWPGVIGVSRATALKRKIEYKYFAIEANEALTNEILDILNHILSTEGYFDAACVESNKILKDSDFIFNTSYSYSIELKLKYLNFVATHFFNIISKSRNENLNSTENQNFILDLYSLEIIDNPIKKVKWFKHEVESKINYDSEHIQELKEDGYEIVKVYHIPEDKGYGISSFMFAENESNMQFYLYVNFLEEGWNRWGNIKEGHVLAIKYRDSDIEGKPHPATEIVEIDTY